VAGSPGAPHSCVTENDARKKNAARVRGVFDSSLMAHYFEMDRLNILSIFSLVASTADWEA
jgi:hypothetical protein